MPDSQYGRPSWTEKVAFAFTVLVHMPIVLVWTLLTSSFHPHNRLKTWKRVVADKAFYHLTKELNAKQLQWTMGTTLKVYEDWVKQSGLPIMVDELGEDARLLWIGKRRIDRVILYFHGGAFVCPMQYFVPSFWEYMQEELEKKGTYAGLAILNYTLVPSGTFPTQLKQATLALEHLISSGARPQNIQIVGDSAGGNLILQLISHILHPLEGIPRTNLSSPIRGAYLMSPWVSLTGDAGSMTSNDDNDIIGTKCINEWGHQVLEGVPDSQLPYIYPNKAPESWFKGIDTVVDRVLITAGSAECLRDPIEVFAKQIGSLHSGADFLMQQNGVHNDPYFDFFTKEKKLGKLTPQILGWLARGFESA